MSVQDSPTSTPICSVLGTSVSDDSLLGSIQNNPSLVNRFERMPVDQKTIEFSSEAPCDPVQAVDASHEVDATSPTSDRRLFETLDHSSNNHASENLGFIPCRQIADLGCGRREDVDYRFVGQLGAGGTGVVFQAHQRAVDREVAVKMLRTELASKPHSRERFLAEARVIGGLDHPNVIALHEVYSDENGSLFYSMKRINGTSWDKQIGDLPLVQNIDILLRVADAIRYAHSRGLIHRDIKPENVMLGKFGEVLLADWGLAIYFQGDSSGGRAAHSVGGTPVYMAPELASASAGAITFQTDVYLLGAILYQILNGRPPHQGETLMECIHAAANNVIQPTSVDGELAEIAMRAMQTKPSDRYEDVEQFIAAIQDQRQHEQSEWLIRRAIRQVEQADSAQENADVYRDFGIADALLAEAIEIWPGNAKASTTRRQLQLKYAAVATERGDYDLAGNLYEAAGESESDEALMVKFHRMRRDVSEVHVSRYSVLFTQSPDAGLLLQLDSLAIVEANMAFGQLFGYRGDHVVGQHLDELEIWVDVERRTALLQQTRRDGSVENFDADLLHTDGHLIDATVNSRIVEVTGEKMLLLTIHDVSAWRGCAK
tara:strand:+ start:67781 stop:69586 length:1806 start_codon:yes stop_codon:yes gene_type:complete